MIDSVSSKLGTTEIVSGTLPSYLTYSVTYSDGVPITSKQILAGNGGTETIKVRLEFKKDVTANQLPGENTTLALNFQVNYVQADNTAEPVGGTPSSFATDSWTTISRAVKRGDTSAYSVGDTKTIDMGTLGTHTLRVANTTTPTECGTTGFSQTACGFVLEFADIITTHRMNPYVISNSPENGTNNKGGWEYSEMRTYVNGDIYNALPTELKNMIIDTTVVSGHGSNDSTNFTTTDKLYLLSTKEVWTNNSYSNNDSAKDLTRTMDYYITNTSYSFRKKQYNGSVSHWWLRSALSNYSVNFYKVDDTGDSTSNISSTLYGVSPAFRLG